MDAGRIRQLDRIHFSMTLWMVIIIAGFAFLFARVVQLKVSPDPRLPTAAGTTLSSTGEMGRRGDIIDRRGRKVATSSIGYRLFVDPQVVEDVSTIGVRLGELIGADPIEIDRAIMARADRRYVVISHLLEDWQVDGVRRASMRGVGLEPRLVRDYPFGETGALVVGKVGFEHTGQGGAELRFEDALLPEGGGYRYVRDASGRVLRVMESTISRSHDGESIRLSIDLHIQALAEARLRQAIEDHNAGGGRLMVADVRTGEILAMCDVLVNREGWDEFTTDPGRAIHAALGRNRCATDPFEPGSTFKPFVWSTATQLGKAGLDEMLDTPEDGEVHRTSQGRRIRDSWYYGRVNWETVLVKSLNSGMAIVAERMTERELRDAVERFGFGTKTAASLPGESAGKLTSRDDWGHYTQTSVPMGQEILVTPLQMVRAFTAFARDGTMIDLTLRARVDVAVPLMFVRRAVSYDTALETRRVLRKVMTDGTGRKAQSELYQIFGKSGTPQLPRKEGGGYHEDRYMPNFIGAAPYDDPRIIAYCVLDDPDKSVRYHGGGASAGPVVRDVIDATLTYLGVAPDLEGIQASGE